MSYHVCKKYRVSQICGDSLPQDDGTWKELHAYQIMLYEKQLIIKTEYAFEMMALLDIIRLHYGYEVPDSLLKLLDDDVKEYDEIAESKRILPRFYGELEYNYVPKGN